MMYKTHAAFGAVFAAGTMVVLDNGLMPLVAVAGALGALLPDLDHKKSKVSTDNIASKIIGIVYRLALKIGAGILNMAAWVARRFKFKVPSTSPGHRGPLTHSPIGILILAFVLSPIAAINWYWYAGLILGAFSHIVIDSLNPQGIMWLWPLTPARIKFLPKFVAPTTASRGEDVVYKMVFVMALMVVFFGASDGIGLMDIQEAINGPRTIIY